MRGCHQCAESEKIRAGRYEGVPWEQTPCATCPAEGYEHASNAEPVETAVVEADEGGSDVMPVWVLTEFVAKLMSMTPRVREAVCLRYQGASYREIAERWGVTPMAAEARVARAIAKWPALTKLFRGRQGVKRDRFAKKQGRFSRSPARAASATPTEKPENGP